MTSKLVDETFAMDVTTSTVPSVADPIVNHNRALALPANFHDQPAVKRAKDKEKKYEDACKAKHCKFVPFVMNTTAKIFTPSGSSLLTPVSRYFTFLLILLLFHSYHRSEKKEERLAKVHR